jgi:DNA-binding transcriptional regulator YhcF (GntR family)
MGELIRLGHMSILGRRHDGFVITLDPESAVPPYEQVRAQLAARITSGDLTAGTRLPPVRRLADDLGLAANTVARAYRDLESAGLVETHGRGGTIVAAGGDRAREQLLQAARGYAALAHALGVPSGEALKLVRTALDPSGADPGMTPPVK